MYFHCISFFILFQVFNAKTFRADSMIGSFKVGTDYREIIEILNFLLYEHFIIMIKYDYFIHIPIYRGYVYLMMC